MFMSLWQEFKSFALKGNMIDMAVGIIIGAAFSKVVSSLVSDLILPPFGLIMGGVDFSKLSVKMHIPGTINAPVELRYGDFITSMINFVLLAGVIFVMIKFMNTLGWKEKETPTTKECPECRMTIPKEATRCGHCTTKLVA
jgi:large conductance mechanosensitive channel